MGYPDTIKDEIVDRFRWATAARKTALKAMVDDAEDADPATFLTDLIALHKSDTTNHSPQFAEFLKRVQWEYSQGTSGDAALEAILRKWSIVPSGGDLV